MIIGVPKEVKDREFRVALTPAGARRLVEKGHRVIVQKAAGVGSGFFDEDYLDAGAEARASASTCWQADLVIKIKEPQPDEYRYLRPALTLFTYLHLAACPELTKELLTKSVTAIGYETVCTRGGTLPLLRPMSEIAGRLSVQIGAHYLEKPSQGKGKLLSGVPGVAPARVVIIGGGTVGANAAQIALGMGAEVTVFDTNLTRLNYLEDVLHGRLRTLFAQSDYIGAEIVKADLVIGAVLLPGAKAPRVVSKEMINCLEPGSVVIDVAIDQGGCIETIRPTTHSEPIFLCEGVIHYGVTNIPGAVPRTSTLALTNATLPYIEKIAALPPEKLLADPELLSGINTYQGLLLCQAVKE